MQRQWRDDPEAHALADELDEIVDAANGLAAVAGLDPDGDDPVAAPVQAPQRSRLSRLERWLPGTS
jgi:hypothetical protein